MGFEKNISKYKLKGKRSSGRLLKDRKVVL
jgi:hypothetical protein